MSNTKFMKTIENKNNKNYLDLDLELMKTKKN